MCNDCKSYKNKTYIKTNRDLMYEVGIKPSGRFEPDALDWIYPVQDRDFNAPKTNNFTDIMVEVLAISGVLISILSLCLFLY